MKTITLNPQLKKLANNSRKRVGFYFVSTRPIDTASYWSDGSREYYQIVNLKTCERKTPPSGSYPTFSAEYELKENEILVNTSEHGGKAGAPSFYVSEQSKELFEKMYNVQDG